MFGVYIVIESDEKVRIQMNTLSHASGVCYYISLLPTVKTGERYPHLRSIGFIAHRNRTRQRRV